MAAPLLADERALGVLQVLDRPKRSRFSLQEMELLGLFANQAAIALSLLDSTRRARAALDGVGDISVVARARGLTDPARRRAGAPPAWRCSSSSSCCCTRSQNERKGPKALPLAAPHRVSRQSRVLTCARTSSSPSPSSARRRLPTSRVP